MIASHAGRSGLPFDVGGLLDAAPPQAKIACGAGFRQRPPCGAPPCPRGRTGLSPMNVLLSITVFLIFGAGFVLGALVVGRLVRPRAPSPEKAMAYECGETPIGSGRVQFDLRFYVMAMVFLVFDVEVALFYPWAVVYGGAVDLARQLQMSAFDLRAVALVDMLFFFGVLLVGFAYLWRFGYLDWVRSAATTTLHRTGLRDVRSSAGAARSA